MSYREFYRRHLPHWQPEGATLFVTTRLARTLPADVIKKLKAQRLAEKKVPSSASGKNSGQWYQKEKKAFARWDAALAHSRSTVRWLIRPEIAHIVSEALHYRDGKVYQLIAFCIMPNHLHIIFTPLQSDEGYHPLEKIMQSLKRYTARQASKILNRTGAFWQAENYDHVVRDSLELERIIQYIVLNPVKAGLVKHWQDWPWTYCNPEYRTALPE